MRLRGITPGTATALAFTAAAAPEPRITRFRS